MPKLRPQAPSAHTGLDRLGRFRNEPGGCGAKNGFPGRDVLGLVRAEEQEHYGGKGVGKPG